MLLKSVFNFLVVVGLSAILNSCLMTYGTYTQTEKTMFHNAPCDKKTDSLYLFFEGEQLNFKYQKLAFLEVKGDENAGTKEVLNEMRLEARNMCANGIININHDVRLRESGRYFDFDEDSKDIYDSKTMTGLAVLIETDSVFLAKHPSPIKDTSYISEATQENLREDKRSNVET